MKIAIDILNREAVKIRKHIDYLKDSGFYKYARKNKKELIEIKKAINELEKQL